MARRCGAKHICASKCTKHHSAGAIFEVQMLKNGTRLWREAHLCVKMYKTPQRRSHFASRDPEKWRAAVARSTFSSQNRKKLTGPDHFLKVRCRKMARPLWRQAHLYVATYKPPAFCSIFHGFSQID